MSAQANLLRELRAIHSSNVEFSPLPKPRRRQTPRELLTKLTDLQANVMSFARARGKAGFTDEDLSLHFGREEYSTYRTRRAELTAAGWIVPTRYRKMLKSGHWGRLWRIATAAERKATEAEIRAELAAMAARGAA